MPLYLPPPDQKNEARPIKRIQVLLVIFIAIFIIYGVKLFSMQILHGDVYASAAQKIARRVTTIPAQRGEIYDRTYTNPLVLNSDSFAVSITPAEAPAEDIADVIGRVAAILEINREVIDKKIPPQYYSLYQPVEVAVNVPFTAIAALAERKDSLPGVDWQSKPLRNYIDPGSLSHVLGYVGNITQDELMKLFNQNYRMGDIIGKMGVEKQYDELLRGKEGREIRTVDVKGRRISTEGFVREPPEMGRNVVLTIDRSIQTLVEKALGKRIGAAVVLRPTTGEILAMVSYPYYDPNIFNQNDMNAQYQALLNDQNKPFLNRAIQSSYPPGSTFKIVMSTGIYAENAFPSDKVVECPGEITYGDRLWRCHIRKPGHGWVNLHQGMAQSCDIYYWVVGRDHLGIERIVSYAKDYGYGELTNIDLPNEIAGFIPTPQWKDRRFHERWQNGDTMNMSIGQGYTLVTPLQMANMVAMAVNSGTIYEPHVLKEVRNPITGEVESSVEPKILHKSDISPSVLRAVRRDMRGVISEGTARFPVNIAAVEIAGKTGTSEVGLQNHWHSWLASYAPYETNKPEERVVVAIIVEAVNNWEWWSPYATAIIYQGIFAHQTYEEAVSTLGPLYQPAASYRRE
ncbi:MAG: penicillin-binding protein 2 [Spirochaetaceae bacterium]|nr:penicillin-binding protein 2 [Spirochaetaceae bacterium]